MAVAARAHLAQIRPCILDLEPCPSQSLNSVLDCPQWLSYSRGPPARASSTVNKGGRHLHEARWTAEPREITQLAERERSSGLTIEPPTRPVAITTATAAIPFNIRLQHLGASRNSSPSTPFSSFLHSVCTQKPILHRTASHSAALGRTHSSTYITLSYAPLIPSGPRPRHLRLEPRKLLSPPRYCRSICGLKWPRFEWLSNAGFFWHSQRRWLHRWCRIDSNPLVERSYVTFISQ